MSRQPITLLYLGLRRWQVLDANNVTGPWPDYEEMTVVMLRRGDRLRTKSFRGHVAHLFEVAS